MQKHNICTDMSSIATWAKLEKCDKIPSFGKTADKYKYVAVPGTMQSLLSFIMSILCFFYLRASLFSLSVYLFITKVLRV